MKSLEDYAIETRKFSDNLLIAYELYCLRCLLEDMGFSLQQNRKYTEAGDAGPDRDAQFRFINDLLDCC